MKNKLILMLLGLIIYSNIVLAQIHTQKFCATVYVDYPKGNDSVASHVVVKSDENDSKEYGLELLDVGKQKINRSYYFCRYLNFTRGSYEIWLESIVDGELNKLQMDTLYYKNLDCDTRFTYQVIGDKIFAEAMSRYRNIGYVDVSGSCDGNKSLTKYYDLAGNERDTCAFILKGKGSENGTIVRSKYPIAQLNNGYISLKAQAKEDPLDRYCVYSIPSRAEIKIPKTKFWIFNLKLNFIDPTPDFIYEDDENKVIVWKIDPSNMNVEYLNINFSYALNWNYIILGFVGMIFALILEFLFKKLIKFLGNKRKRETQYMVCPFCQSNYNNKWIGVHMLKCRYK